MVNPFNASWFMKPIALSLLVFRSLSLLLGQSGLRNFHEVVKVFFVKKIIANAFDILSLVLVS